MPPWAIRWSRRPATALTPHWRTPTSPPEAEEQQRGEPVIVAETGADKDDLLGPTSGPARQVGLTLMTAWPIMVGFHLVLRRALHELDPGKVIPDRVQQAFDALSDVVIVMEGRLRIGLVDTTFEAASGSG